MNKLSLALGFAATALVTGCGGGGSSTPTTPPVATQAGEISGVAAKGIIQKATVTAYEYQGAAEPKKIGEAVTDDKGQYSIEYKNYTGGVVKLVLKAGTETTMKCDIKSCGEGIGFGESVTLPEGFTLQSVVSEVAESEKSIRAPITPYTDMAAARFDEAVKAEGATPAKVASDAISEVSAITGYNVGRVEPVDITDPVAVEKADADTQRAAIMGAAVLALVADGSIADAVKNLSDSFADDGQFDSSDSVKITELTKSWTDTAAVIAEEDSVKNAIDQSVTKEIDLVADDIDSKTSEGTFNPEPTDSAGDTDVAKARELVADIRDILRNIHEADKANSFDQIEKDITDGIEVFDHDVLAMFDVSTIAYEEMFDIIESSEALKAGLESADTHTMKVTIKDGDRLLGELDLVASKETGLKLVLNGDITGVDADDKNVILKDVTISSDMTLAQLREVLLQSDTDNNVTASGTMSSGETVVTLGEAELVATTKDYKKDGVERMTINAPTASIENGSSFAGSVELELVRRAQPFITNGRLSGDQDDNVLTQRFAMALKTVSVDGDFTTEDRVSSHNFTIKLPNIGSFDLTSYLDDNEVVYYEQSRVLGQDKLNAIIAKAGRDIANGASFTFGKYLDEAGEEQSYRLGTDNIDQLPVDELLAIYNPMEILQAQLGDKYKVLAAGLEVTKDGHNLVGKIDVSDLDETEENFVQWGFSFSEKWQNFEGLPTVIMTANIERDLLNGGQASWLLSWDGKQYKFNFKDVNTTTNLTNLVISNPMDVALSIPEFAFQSNKVEGALKVGDKKVADVKTTKGLLKISYIDNTFETLE
ncbi:hypothetical protein [Pelagibaculum spongiae]|uniref:Lipoprotein n=1 Tax=Pelagibaculum spongiae TaxID=2080658 RepID=A0A2V1H1A8_9GAMM|nr:hypothetical protein [Pelagibaculum spongiae]PVZ72283.1 hypothetical protein DC094_04525 [Pelagibaculum spongiae]